MDSPIIYWFRQDLRLDDLPGFAAAVATGRPILPCYILDDHSPQDWRAGGAGRWWLHNSLAALSAQIETLGGQLILASGRAGEVLAEMASSCTASAVYCSRQYEPWAGKLEREAFTDLQCEGIELKRYPGALLWEPETVANRSGLPYKVFTPFWRACRSVIKPARPCGAPGPITWHRQTIRSLSLQELNLKPLSPNWAEDWELLWRPGERGARERLERFLEHSVSGYSEARDYPAESATSLLSAHLHFGEISPSRVYYSVADRVSQQACAGNDGEKFLSEVGWREFSYHLLFHFHDIPEKPFKPAFTVFPWVGRPQHFEAWKSGTTGYPLVDAGMRELWRTGYMHNRVRMVASSFLCKHLLIDWRAGQRWFWDTLVDADLANNSCGWQWVAGSGADASPYFRIFNPITQAKRFDAQARYIRQWVPELSALPDAYIHEPWKAPETVLNECQLTLGVDYPEPIVDHKQAREAALSALGEMRTQ